ncbi:alpha-glucoside transport system permease protein [Devosia enhydra]|uniref:Alpha-glucoside transport system permease protein n=1 Tax=Devosia enhydra TaxID=665118 RepID=A0A1K2I0T6_9HYPH|nr:sugar ABC transporter permease [Devosia enhydra]SFZ85929.1 alpha-glucoside transport system permease protein [Devosia enhydra]
MQIWNNLPVLVCLGAVLLPCLVYLWLGLGERILARLGAGTARVLRPWFWLSLPLAVVALVLVYPLVVTIWLALRNNRSTEWVGLRNFQWAFSGEMIQVMGNSLLWLVALPLGTIVLSLVAAVLFDRVKYEKLAITIILLPTAISFTAASIIWRQLYSYQPADAPQVALLNAIWMGLGASEPVAWLQTPVLNSICLIVVALWASVGVATLIVSAGVKNVPAELREAALIDGAGEWRIFFLITLPQIVPAILVVLTTSAVFALKVFDIVYIMTNGQYGTDVVANRMYSELFTANNAARASAIAVLLLIAAIPIALANLRLWERVGK